jgi:hypothetical protein
MTETLKIESVMTRKKRTNNDYFARKAAETCTSSTLVELVTLVMFTIFAIEERKPKIEKKRLVLKNSDDTSTVLSLDPEREFIPLDTKTISQSPWISKPRTLYLKSRFFSLSFLLVSVLIFFRRSPYSLRVSSKKWIGSTQSSTI